MIPSSPRFEFALPANGDAVQYQVHTVHTEDGQLQQVSIWHNPPEAETVAIIDIDPQLFKQFALPNVETFCRIAIAQAATEGAFGEAGRHCGMTLDLAIEPWEGELALA